MMRIDVDDREFLVAALLRLLGRMRQQLGRVELFDRHATEVIRLQFHAVLGDLFGYHIKLVVAAHDLI